MYNEKIKTILDVANNFNTEKKCIKHLEKLYWPGEPISPFDNSSKIYTCKKGRYKCKNTKKYFTVKTGTMFDGTKISLPKWFLAIFLLTNEKKGISSLRLASHINVSQKTAWYMLHRIRANFEIEYSDEDKMVGICEADETFVGGKNKNRHRDKKVEQSQGRSFKDKTPILGVIQRGDYDIITRPHKQKPHIMVDEKVIKSYSKVRTKVIPDTKKESVQPFIYANVSDWTMIVTDEWHAYKNLDSNFDHHIVDHGRKQYVDFDRPEIHSNSIEGYWSIFKRSYNGIYNHMTKKHLQKYSDEHSWRFNLRGLKVGERFYSLILNNKKRTKYRNLVNGN